jgi:putative Holliday junction resolvase
LKIKPSRLIGIDFGAARIGVAYSDEQKIIAMPLTIVKTESKSEATVAKLVKELNTHALANHYTIAEIVIGLPLMMSGRVGLQADEVKHFVKLLQAAIEVPIITWDERLTTVQADRSMREGHMTRKKRAQIVDTVAAVIILQNYLDHKKLSEL